jgi:hypothetical protein
MKNSKVFYYAQDCQEKLNNIIITVVIAFLVYEFVEHVAFHLIWFIKNRNKKSNCGVTGMIGKVVEIKRRDETEGKVLLWSQLQNPYLHMIVNPRFGLFPPKSHFVGVKKKCLKHKRALN